jgi:hypothetical protein
MTTLLQVCKQIVKDSIDQEYLGNQTLREVYMSEYGYRGINQTACKDYLQGLPSVCTVPFTNHDLLFIAEKHGLCPKRIDAQYKLIDDYWEACGYAFYQLIKN